VNLVHTLLTPASVSCIKKGKAVNLWVRMAKHFRAFTSCMNVSYIVVQELNKLSSFQRLMSVL
jgi:hypothetical protein